MISLLSLVKKKRLNFFIKIFFPSIFLFGCARIDKPENSEKIAGFFEELLLEHGGAYTLFGSKPMTEEYLIELTPEEIEQQNEYFKTHPEISVIYVDRNLEEGWNEWKKNSKLSLSSNYILREIEFQHHKMLIFVNMKNTILAIREHYNEFKRILGQDFVPEELVQHLREDKVDQWRQILLDHVGKGILFGYGYKNASLFQKRIQVGSDAEDNIKTSENNDPRIKAECYLNNKPFRIPIFAIHDEKESRDLILQYKKERDAIKKKYEGRDFLKVTLEQLKCKENRFSQIFYKHFRPRPSMQTTPCEAEATP